jgi:hypothetical protein
MFFLDVLPLMLGYGPNYKNHYHVIFSNALPLFSIRSKYYLQSAVLKGLNLCPSHGVADQILL